MAKKKVVPFTDEEIALIHSAARRTFEYLAGDVFSQMPEGAVMKRRDVVELVCDANYMAQHLKQMKASPELIKRVFDYLDLEKLVTPAFPYSTYS